MKLVTDIAMKLGGVLALVGMIAGAWVWSSTTCTQRLGGGRTCSNVWAEVPLNAFGQPDTAELFLTGGAIGAVVGAVLGLVAAALWPHLKADLFP